MHSFKYFTAVLVTTLLAGAGATSCRDGKRYHSDIPATPTRVDSPSESGLSAIRSFQEEKNREFRDPQSSPLSQEELRRFSGLDFFAPDTAYQVMARLVRSPEALPFDMPTNTDRTTRERKYGTVYFELMGKPCSLEVYQSPDLIMQEGYGDYLFLPFTDRTNGEETYEGGRYMDLRIPSGDSLLLDFNTAYNPTCAYNPEYSCPVVPGVNHLDLSVRAGVKAYIK